MQFSAAQLPDHDLVRAAFHAAYERVMTGESFAETCRAVEKNVRDFYAGQAKLYLHTQDRDEFNRRLRDVVADRRQDLMRVPQIARDVLENDFAVLCIDHGPVRALLDGGAEASPQLLAAAILLPTVLSDADEDAVAQSFGAEVADLIHAARHMTEDPDMAFYSAEDLADFAGDPADSEVERDNLAAADPEAQLLYYARLIADLRRTVDETKAAMRADVRLTPASDIDQDDRLFMLAGVVYGCYPALDFLFRDCFNQQAELTAAPYRLQEDRLGALERVPESLYALQRQEVLPKPSPQRADSEPPRVGML